MSPPVPPIRDDGFPHLPPQAPQVKARWRRFLGVFLMRLTGWRIAGNIPDIPKFVIIVAPHTSNWDFLNGILAYLALQLDTTWLGKHTIFVWPLGALARRFGGVPIDRAHGNNVVRASVAEFARRRRMSLAITPEGTRSRVKEWKLGFYHIAAEAKVPIVPVALNYPQRLVMILPPVPTTGDIAVDLPKIKALYSRGLARYPEKF